MKQFPTEGRFGLRSPRGCERLNAGERIMRLARSCIFRAFSIVAAGWAGWEIPLARAATDQDFDFACAVVSAAEIATTKAGSDEQNMALQIQFFYLGRLSGRDDRTYWAAVVKGRLAELKTKAKAPDLYGSCAAFVTKNID